MDFLNILVVFFSRWGYLAVFAMLLACGLGLPIPEDITLVSGGVISGLEETGTNPHFMVIISMAGVLFGDTFVFFIGLIYGIDILQTKWVSRFITPERYVRVQESFQKYGRLVVFFARFMPGLRMPIYLVAGISKRVSALLFILTDFLAAIISVPLWVYLGYFGARNRKWLVQKVHEGQVGLMLIMAFFILAALGIFFYKREINK